MEAAEGAFGSELEDHDWERERKILPPSRALAAYDGDKAVGLAAAYAFDLSIPGGELPCAGVTWVGVLPTHRRRGILRDFMRRQLADVQGWGEPIAALWASEASIYGRFGYGAGGAGRGREVRIRDGSRSSDEPASNLSVRLDRRRRGVPALPAGLRPRARRAGRGCSRARRPGGRSCGSPTPKEWRRGASQKFYAVAEVDGNGRGLHDLPGQGRVGGRLRRRARCAWSRLFATSTAVERELWRFLHSIDLTVKVDVFSLDPGLVALPQRARPARARPAARRRALAAARRPRCRAEGALLQAGGVGRARGDATSSAPGTRAATASATTPAGPRTPPISRSTSPISRPPTSARSTSTGSCTPAAPQERRDGAAEAATLLFRTDLPPYCPEVF